jgi:hypothetical protein
MMNYRNFKSLLLIIFCTLVKQNLIQAAEDHPVEQTRYSTSLGATSGYNTQTLNQLCDGFPQVPISSAKGICVGLLGMRSQGLSQPRYGVQVDETTLLVTDMDGWSVSNGTIWAIQFDRSLNNLSTDERPNVKVTNLFPKNNLPNPAGIAMDPQGSIYVGLITGIYKFKLERDTMGNIKLNPKLVPFITDFDSARGFTKNIFAAEEFAHPLTQFVFSPDHRFIFINFGSKTDSCVKSKSSARTGKEICPENTGHLAFATVRRYALDENYEVIPNSGMIFAKGLRNSMAMAIHSSGLLIQGENSRDLPESESPAEEINILNLSADKLPLHFGWPYCFNNGAKRLTAPEFLTRQQECSDGNFVPPLYPLPAHSSPLGMLYVSDKKLPSMNSKLLISLHGYAAHGHRLVALPVTMDGVPVTESALEEVVFNWGSSSNLNPLGAPTGLLEWSDGSVIVFDDKNGAILRLSKGQSINKLDLVPKNSSFIISDPMVERFSDSNKIFVKKCSSCHSEISTDARKSLSGLIQSGKLNPAGLDESSLLMKIRYKEMPPRTVDKKEFPPLTPAERKKLLKDLLQVF